MYAGVRPERVARLVNLEGFGAQGFPPGRCAGALRPLAGADPEATRLRDYADFDELADRLRSNNPRLTRARAVSGAALGEATENGRVELRSDPAHKLINPVLYRLEEAMACWRNYRAGAVDRGREFAERERAAHLCSDRDSRKACFSNLSAQTIADAGHMLHHDQPELLAAIIEAFLLG